MIPSKVTEWLSDSGYGHVASKKGVGGGCINQGVQLTTSTGSRFFLKTNPNCPPDMFACEVAGLKALDVAGGPRVPAPYMYGVDFLLMEDLAPARQIHNYSEVFGRQMATLHQHTGDRFGFDGDNYIGSTPQPNPWTDDGHQFFADSRLNYQAELAGRRGLLSQAEVEAVSSISNRLTALVPNQPPSILHGDLWSGNSISDAEGQPAIIDPAAYYGWAEADLAMMVLFGSPGQQFWHAYQETRPLEDGWRDRFDLYNLYHVLNHLNLFGRGYYGQVMRIIKKYA